MLLKSLAGLYPGEVAGVSMLGSGEPLDWKQTEKGLWVAPPKEKPCRHAFVLKIRRRPPFASGC